MKLNAALAKSLLMAASIGIVVPIAAQTSTSKGRNARAKTAEKAAAEQPEADAAAAEEIVLPGIVIDRPKGGFLSLELEDGKFRLSFFDAEKKAMPVDVARATARWNPKNKIKDERTVLNPADDGQALKGAVFVQGPYVFKLYLTLLDAEGNVVEHHVIDFRQ